MTYEVEVTREGKSWLATVRGLPGAHTYAGNLTVLRENVYEVIELVTDVEGDRPPLRYVFTDDADALIAEAAVVGIEREEAESALAAAQAASSSIAQQLAAAGYSVRDMAGALRLTPGRVSQILGATRDSDGSKTRERRTGKATKTAAAGLVTGKSTSTKNLSAAAKALRTSGTGRYAMGPARAKAKTRNDSQ